MKNFLIGMLFGVVVIAGAEVMAKPWTSKQPRIDVSIVDKCGEMTVEELDIRVDRIEELMWALHAPINRQRKELRQIGVERYLLNMRNDQTIREQASLTCYSEEQ